MAHNNRHLAAIMVTDLADYSRIQSRDETRALALLTRHRDILKEVIEGHGGKLVKTLHDVTIFEFASALTATQAGIAVLEKLASENETSDEDGQMHVRVGIHLGDVEHVGDEVHGEGVMIASRIERLAPRGPHAFAGRIEHSFDLRL